jgi:hypothetical protein
MANEERAALAWLFGGDTGLSSKAILMAALGIRSTEPRIDYPLDPADLGRCLRMLDLMPWAFHGVDELAMLSKRWCALRTHWDELRICFENEVGIAWEKGSSARKTFRMMQRILGE